MDRPNKRHFALAAPRRASSGVLQRSPLEDPPHLGSARAVSAVQQHFWERTCARAGAVQHASRLKSAGEISILLLGRPVRHDRGGQCHVLCEVAGAQRTP
jgi:hypothetical protein